MSRLLDKYEIIKRISEGHFGVVYKVRSKEGTIIRPNSDIRSERNGT